MVAFVELEPGGASDVFWVRVTKASSASRSGVYHWPL